MFDFSDWKSARNIDNSANKNLPRSRSGTAELVSGSGSRVFRERAGWLSGKGVF